MSLKPTEREAMFPFRSGRMLPRGELWLGSELLAHAGYSDTFENHLRLADLLAHDLVCFPVAVEAGHKPSLGYRFFSYADLRSAVRISRQTVAAVVDGPFQELVNQMGLMAVLTKWARHKAEIVNAYSREQARVMERIQGCLDQGVRLLVIADDLAADNGPLVNPSDLESLCTTFYTRAVSLIHAADARVFWHCCGNLASLIPLVSAWRLDGLAAVQPRVNHMIDLYEALGPGSFLLSGIENELLDSDTPPPAAMAAFKQIVSTLAPTGHLILGSCCGLYRGVYLSRIQRIYEEADRLLTLLGLT